jgi:hypoxanthine-guanine phosphoribosyltransferase
MKRCLKEDKLINNGDPTKKIRYGEDMFLEAVKLITNDILEKFPNKNYGLIGVARGGLPLLVSVSHRLDIRRIDVVQIKMSNSDKQWDFGTAEMLGSTLNDEIDEYIIFEDIVARGRSVNLLVNELKKKNKKVLAIYSLVLNEVMKDLKLDNEDMDIVYVDMINPSQWVNFFWENGYVE